MATYVNGLSSNGTLTLTQSGAPGVVWNLTSMSISFAGPSRGPNARVSIYDGTAATGTLLFRIFLDQPTASIGFTVDVTQYLPADAKGQKGVQASPGATMTIVVEGFGANLCSANARLMDGLP